MTNFLSGLAYLAPEPNLIGRLVGLLFDALGGAGNYWLTVILFTFFLKLITTPLDYWQRLTGKKNALKLERIQPQLDAIQKKYGGDKGALAQKQQELYRATGYSPMGACLPLIVTMVIMIYMFTGLNSFATYKQVQEFNALESIYVGAIQEYVDDNLPPAYRVTVNAGSATADAANAFDAYYLDGSEWSDHDGDEDWWTAYAEAWTDFNLDMIDKASAEVYQYYTANKEGFLWIKNIWRSDTPWTKPVLSSADFQTIAKLSNAEFNDIEYDNIMRTMISESEAKNEVNGYLVLPLLAMALMFFSQKIMSKNNQTGMPQSDMMRQQTKMMQWLTPIMFGVFGLFYTAAVSLYMFANSLYSIVLSFAINWLVSKKMEKLTASDNRRGYRR